MPKTGSSHFAGNVWRRRTGKLKQTVAELERRIGVLELKEGLTGGTDSKRAQARINRLMREIDRCIALMNR